jgi:hypothetical protein
MVDEEKSQKREWNTNLQIEILNLAFIVVAENTRFFMIAYT